MRTDRPPLTFDDVRSGVTAVTLDPRLTSTYRPWRKVRHIAEDLDADPIEIWKQIKAARMPLMSRIPVPRAEGGYFSYAHTPLLARPLHRIDRAALPSELVNGSSASTTASLKRWSALLQGGELLSARVNARTLMGEAAESSIMEGASKTRAEALDLLRSGRPARDAGERMIINNYLGMQQVKQWLDRPLSIELLLELQELLTDGTLEKAADSGRLRTPHDNVRVIDSRNSETIFVPPPADQVRPLLQSLCDFANAQPAIDGFMHPVVKASILHFLLGYIHPFVDGNGRTARALFYWYSLRHRYDVFEYLSISEIIRKGYARYPQAYIDTELDDGDLTYFVLYKLDIIEQALDRLAEHLRHEEEKVRRSERLLKLAKDLNLRQRLLLEHALRHPGTQYTVKSHMNSNGIVAVTARTDLEDLVRRRLMTTTKRGREVIYLVTSTLAERLARKGL